jgi:hypothetical protein
MLAPLETVSKAEPTTPSIVAWIRVVPETTALTTPVAETTAMLVFCDDQTTFLPVSTVPPALTALAAACAVDPVLTLVLSSATTTMAVVSVGCTGGGEVAGGDVAGGDVESFGGCGTLVVSPGSITVTTSDRTSGFERATMYATPGFLAATTPCCVTVATESSELCHEASRPDGTVTTRAHPTGSVNDSRLRSIQTTSAVGAATRSVVQDARRQTANNTGDLRRDVGIQNPQLGGEASTKRAHWRVSRRYGVAAR